MARKKHLLMAVWLGLGAALGVAAPGWGAEADRPAQAQPAAPPLAAGVIPAEDFARLHALLEPQPGESKWAEVPWLTSLPEARRRAAAEDRPLFVWRAGGGEVLGRA